ncbi:hypothetical protein F5148DRAFT_1210563 [Russula earlei]|uniref:Uncharacterized protein n=1 Tax=Russula earlei TaxID=71964 RepID=A0ACC0U5L9_9AGAM|nr:hypothetical protein F5148DRAFT_1210563 [Russula earlei]
MPYLSRHRRASAAAAATLEDTWPSRSFSERSTASIPDSCFYSLDFMLGASMVIIQPSSGKVVLVNDTSRNKWFLPRGRKDIGETLEQCALREAYEESGYRVQFLPLHLLSRAPAPPERPTARHELMVSEPIYITTTEFGPYYRRGVREPVDSGGEYITFYYVGQIPADAVREELTGMPDEMSYVGKLLELEEALSLLPPLEGYITRMAYLQWRRTIEIEERRQSDEAAELHPHSRRRHHSANQVPTARESSD